MNEFDHLWFLVQPFEDDPKVLTVTPVLNGTSLTVLVAEFEKEYGFEPVGDYAGIIPQWFRYGRLNDYFMANTGDDYWEKSGYYLLGCSCGEVGCWPLVARIMRTEETVVWGRFRQPHRPSHDYSGFGPFRFEIGQYRAAVNELAQQFGDVS